MKDLDTTWSHIVSRKLSLVRENRGMTTTELAEKVGVSQAHISTVLSRSKKGNEETFTKIGIALGMPERQIKDMLIASMFEAIEQEYGAGFSFALKSQFGLSENAIKDVLKFIKDIQKREQDDN